MLLFGYPDYYIEVASKKVLRLDEIQFQHGDGKGTFEFREG